MIPKAPMFTRPLDLVPFTLLALFASGAFGSAVAFAQASDRAHTESMARRATDRLQALQHEADSLATQERTLLVELRKFEVERELKTEELRRIDAELDTLAAQLGEITERMERLEQMARSQVPALQARLVDLYKLGDGGYVRLLLAVDDVRSAAQAYRQVSALARLDRERVIEHRKTLLALKIQRQRLQQRTQKMASLQSEARRARAAAERATRSRTELVARIDSERDLAAQLMGELQASQNKLQQALAASSAEKPPDIESVALPLRPFRGDLDWPAPGRVIGQFGRDPKSRYGTAIARSGIDIAAPEFTAALAVHEGIVGFADTFTGFGNLVIVDHGNESYSLYGNLGSLSVRRGARVDRGDTVGTVGASPTGNPALYFELRIDGKAVDPVEWLKKR